MSLEGFLKSILQDIPQADYPVHSRIHSLKTFGDHSYVKREDELGFGISGSKIRKYRSLIPALLNEGIEEVVLIGGAYSNHILGMTQLLLENQIQPVLFLREMVGSIKGNHQYLQLFIEASRIHWVPRNQWKQVIDLAKEYVNHSEKRGFLIPEGGLTSLSLPGLLSLSLDILRNERESKISFEHIFIEAGTGLSAISLILGLYWCQHLGKIHVLLLAEDESAFMKRLDEFQQVFENLMGKKIAYPTNFVLHLPETARSFGSTNQQVFKMIKQIACKEGFLTDPIYSAKLFLEGQRILNQGSLQGNVLFIHSGGGLALGGYLEQTLNRDKKANASNP